MARCTSLPEDEYFDVRNMSNACCWFLLRRYITMHGSKNVEIISFLYGDEWANTRLPPETMFKPMQKCIQQIFMFSVHCICPILTVNSSFTAFMMVRLSVLKLRANKRPYMELSRDANASEMTEIHIENRNINPRVRPLGHCHRQNASWVIAWRWVRWTDWHYAYNCIHN
jgi:hypothetical protein